MDARFTCPECRATHHWPPYVRGKPVTCPQCKQDFVASEVTEQKDEDLPAVLPVDPNEPLDVLPVPGRLAQPLEEDRKAPAPPPDGPAVVYSPELAQRIEASTYYEGLTLGQRTVFALLDRTFDLYTSETGLLVLGYGAIPFLVVAGVIVAFLAMAVAHLLAAAIDQRLDYVLYLLPLLMLLFAREMEALARDRRAVDFSELKNAVQNLSLGRLDDIFNFGAPGNTAFWFGVSLSFQFGLLYYTPNHSFLPVEGGFQESFMLTLDNACHGLFLFTFDIYNIHLAGRFEHSIGSGTIFYFFRLVYDALALLLLYQLYQRWRLRGLFRDYSSAGPDRLAGWIEEKIADDYGWPRRFFDEFMFLMLAAQYLRGNYELVRQVSRQFPRLRVASRVRDLFVDRQGKRTFESCLEE